VRIQSKRCHRGDARQLTVKRVAQTARSFAVYHFDAVGAVADGAIDFL
jgi:hypothetical protein